MRRALIQLTGLLQESCASRFLLGPARNCWSDVACIDSLFFDMTEVAGCPVGYVEARSRHVKQSSQAKKKKAMFMPLMAPIQGVSPDFCWALEWRRAAQLAGIDLTRRPLGALSPAPGPDGTFLKRHIDTAEASDWLRGLLLRSDPTRQRTTSHCLEHTVLGGSGSTVRRRRSWRTTAQDP